MAIPCSWSGHHCALELGSFTSCLQIPGFFFFFFFDIFNLALMFFFNVFLGESLTGERVPKQRLCKNWYLMSNPMLQSTELFKILAILVIDQDESNFWGYNGLYIGCTQIPEVFGCTNSTKLWELRRCLTASLDGTVRLWNLHSKVGAKENADSLNWKLHGDFTWFGGCSNISRK